MKSKKIFNPRNFETAYLKNYPSTKIIPADELLPELFKVYYGVKTVDQISPEIGTPCAFAYVPYYHGKTKLLMFNFFSRNYGIRDPLLIRVSLIKGSKICSIKQSIFAPDQVYLEEFLDTNNDDVCQFGTALVEIFHPRIKTQNDQFRFFVIFRDQNEGKISGVHSMGFNKLKIHQKQLNTGYRSYTPSQTQAHYFDMTEPRMPLVSDNKQNGELLLYANLKQSYYYTLGYLCLEDDANSPSGIWHDNLENNTVNVCSNKFQSGTNSPCMTAFYVPDFQHNAPVALISSHEIGFQPESLLIRAFYESGELITERSIEVKSDPDSIDLAKVFSEDSIEGSTFFVVNFGRELMEFENAPPCSLSLYYGCGRRFADQVHSLTSHYIGYQQELRPNPKSYRMRKMAPFFKEDGLKFAYSIVTANLRKISEVTVNLRVFTDMGTEHVFNRYPLLNDGVAVIHGDSLMETIDSNIEQSAVIWFEHQTLNFNGAWFAIDKNTGHVGVDHFTGG